MFIVRNIGQLISVDPISDNLDEIVVAPCQAFVFQSGVVVWVGDETELPEQWRRLPEVDCQGQVVMPGLVECHTHLVFAGNRSHEFELRSQGATYEDIARAGGGIAHTVASTRAASREQLLASGLARLDRFVSFGVTTVEAKSGYGLDQSTERAILECHRALDSSHPVDVVSTFLGAHTLPPEYKDNRTGYVDIVCQEMLPEVAEYGLAAFCDVFCEQGAFTLDESRRILETARSLGLATKIHAEQLSRSRGAELAAELRSTSADHLEHATRPDAAALAQAGTVAVLLPGATAFLGKKQFADARDFLSQGGHVAVSTDFNPGSCHSQNLWLMGTLACAYNHLKPSQALASMTFQAARAIGMGHRLGAIAPGYQADFLLLDCCDWKEILYCFGSNPVKSVFKKGNRVI